MNVWAWIIAPMATSSPRTSIVLRRSSSVSSGSPKMKSTCGLSPAASVRETAVKTSATLCARPHRLSIRSLPVWAPMIRLSLSANRFTQRQCGVVNVLGADLGGERAEEQPALLPQRLPQGRQEGLQCRKVKRPAIGRAVGEGIRRDDAHVAQAPLANHARETWQMLSTLRLPRPSAQQVGRLAIRAREGAAAADLDGAHHAPAAQRETAERRPDRRAPAGRGVARRPMRRGSRFPASRTSRRRWPRGEAGPAEPLLPRRRRPPRSPSPASPRGRPWGAGLRRSTAPAPQPRLRPVAACASCIAQFAEPGTRRTRAPPPLACRPKRVRQGSDPTDRGSPASGVLTPSKSRSISRAPTSALRLMAVGPPVQQDNRSRQSHTRKRVGARFFRHSHLQSRAATVTVRSRIAPRPCLSHTTRVAR